MRICNCGSKSVETDEKMGHIVCVSCGEVVEENVIVAEVQFSENSKGGTIADGFQVSANQARASHKGSHGFARTGGAESRETTLANGYKRIKDIGNMANIRMASTNIEKANQYYHFAVTHNFNRGRRTDAVVAACLYIVCRKEGTSLMLIDFADALSINVYQIGATLLALLQLTQISLPQVDPTLFLHRFAAKLDFGEKTKDVTNDATRLAQRMNRDWMTTGRRPAGICAASLFVAARMNGFDRTIREIVLIVKICQGTLRKRLVEFQNTSSSQLSVHEFKDVWLGEEKDPPAFTQTKKRVLPAEDDAQYAPSVSVLESEWSENQLKQEEEEAKGTEFDVSQLDHEVEELLELDDLKSAAREMEESRIVTEDEENVEESLSDLDNDPDIQAAIDVSPEEVDFRRQVFDNENVDWIAKEAAKELLASSGGIVKKRPGKKRQKKEVVYPSGDTPAEATRNMIQSKPSLSKKINYDMIDSLVFLHKSSFQSHRLRRLRLYNILSFDSSSMATSINYRPSHFIVSPNSLASSSCSHVPLNAPSTKICGKVFLPDLDCINSLASLFSLQCTRLRIHQRTRSLLF